MADIRSLLANIRMNPPPLRTPKCPDIERSSDIFFIGDDCTPPTTTIVDKLNQHRKNEIVDEKQAVKNDPFKWIKIKEKMIIDMENKRDEQWKKQAENDKIENEEIDDGEAALDEMFNDDDDDEVEKEDAKNTVMHDDDNEDEAESEDEVDQNEYKEKKEKKNIFLDDEAEESNDDDDDHEIDHESESEKSGPDDDNQDLVVSKTVRKKTIIDDDSESEHAEDKPNDDDDNFNHFDSNFHLSVGGENLLNPHFSENNYNNFCVSQNLPLTPAFQDSGTVKNDLILEPHDDLPIEFDSQVAGLCSGLFGDFSGKNATPTDSKCDENLDIISSKSNNDADPNQSDDESDENEEEEEVEVNLNNDDDDDGEEEEEEEEEQEEQEDDGITPERQSKMKVSDFFENEAELSGSEDDVSSDEHEDDEDEDELVQDEILEDLPSDDELRGQVEKIYNKNLLDEDKRQMMILKEMFFDDGDLHEEGDDRRKKFRWQLSGDIGDFTNVLSDDSDEEADSNDDDDGDDDEGDNRFKMIRLKKDKITEKLDAVDNIEQSKSLTTTIAAVDVEDETVPETEAAVATKENSLTMSQVKNRISIVPKMAKKSKSSGKISSFFIKDERLKGILSKRSTASNAGNDKFNCKKQKTQDSRSIFDVINC